MARPQQVQNFSHYSENNALEHPINAQNLLGILNFCRYKTDVVIHSEIRLELTDKE